MFIGIGLCSSQMHAQELRSSAQERPLFTENLGQLKNQHGEDRFDIHYYTKTGSFSTFITDWGMSFQLEKFRNSNSMERGLEEEADSLDIYRIDMRASLQQAGSWTVDEEALTRLNICKDGDVFQSIPQYEVVHWTDQSGSLQMDFYFKSGNLKYDIVLSPGASTDFLSWDLQGCDALEITKDGNLLMHTHGGIMIQEAPLAYQNGVPLEAYWKIDGWRISIEVPNRDPDHILIIDPVVREWGTYYGGTKRENFNGTASDPLGNVYVAGMAESSGNIATSGVHQQTISGQRDAILIKFNSYGQRLWATYFGGSGLDVAQSCATHESQFVYISGSTTSSNGLATPGAHQATKNGGEDGFLAQFDQTGQLGWATYYGGNALDGSSNCATDLSGDVYMVGFTESINHIASAPSHQSNIGGNTDGFLAKFDASGQRVWGTYYGGTSEDRIMSVSTSRSSVYICGWTVSDSSIASVGVHQESYSGGISDGFVAKFDGQGNREWGSYLGGLAIDEASSCDADGRGNLYVAGHTSSAQYMSSNGSHQELLAGSYDAFLTKFNQSGSVLWSTYLGGSGWDYGTSCALDAQNNVYLAGYCRSDSGIASPNAYQDVWAGKFDAFLTKFDSLGIRDWSTYYGGSSYEYGTANCADANGAVYLAGHSWTNYVLSSAGSQQSSLNGGPDGFLAKFIQCAPNTGSMSVSECWSYTSPSGNHVWSTSGVYKDTLVNSGGCDSVVDINLTIIQGPTKTISPNGCNFYVSPSGNQIWDSSGVYMDFVPNPNGCDSMIIVNLSLQYGPKDTISAQGCNEYLSPSGDQLWTSSGWYLDYVDNPLGCDSILFVDLTIIPLELNLIKNGATLTALESGATYQWLDCNANFIPIPGATGQSYTSVVAGAFAVIIEKNGCQDTSICYTITEANVGMSEFDVELRLFPNPNKGEFTLLLPAIWAQTDMIIIDALGRRMDYVSDWIKPGELKVNALLPPGYYTLRLVDPSGEQWHLSFVTF
jgi:hypothetical protein